VTTSRLDVNQLTDGIIAVIERALDVRTAALRTEIATLRDLITQHEAAIADARAALAAAQAREDGAPTSAVH
jgi:hypothetical protein